MTLSPHYDISPSISDPAQNFFDKITGIGHGTLGKFGVGVI
jgi:hypothetical protein